MKISQQIKSIETISTSGELGALLKESEMIKKLQPLYNRKLRLSRKLMVLKSKLNKEGYQTVEYDEQAVITVEELDSIIGVFRSKRQAKEFLIQVAKAHSLCERLLGLENTKGACFAYRLGRCKGACNGKEEGVMYNLRFLQAVSKNKFKPWPFEGPILIREEEVLEDKGEAFLLDQWCYLGNVSYNEFSTEPVISREYNFDLDTYKIINSYLRQPKNHKKIHHIGQKKFDYSPHSETREVLDQDFPTF